MPRANETRRWPSRLAGKRVRAAIRNNDIEVDVRQRMPVTPRDQEQYAAEVDISGSRPYWFASAMTWSDGGWRDTCMGSDSAALFDPLGSVGGAHVLDI